MTSSVDSHTIPPFYACYLMRSCATNSSIRTYIGSTPDPIRRKKQHNGILTQGAHKTRKGRPWETQMIIWGFPSKIAALQFEWAWQKPHLSRHLRTNKPDIKEIEAGPSTTTTTMTAHVPLPLFTDTPRNQVAVSADGTAGLSTHSIQSCMMVARALLRSEPFSTWGLRITFFEEYCWAGWIQLERVLNEQLSTGIVSDAHNTVGLQLGKSRLGRSLPADHLSPAPICEFSGVDGNKKTLLSLNEEEKKKLKLVENRKQTKQGRSPGQWPEKLPQVLNAKTMGVTWKMIKEAPQTITPTLESHNDSSIDAEQVKRLRWNDEDVAELSLQRYMQYLKKEKLEMMDLRGGKDSRQCYLCRSDITLQDHLTYTTCPSPFLQLQPRSQLDSDEKTPTLSQFGFSNGTKDTLSILKDIEVDESCSNIFHVPCLARHFSRNSQEHITRFILPTHGCCPCCNVEGQDKNSNTWVNIIRSVYRRKERLEIEYLKADIAKAKEEKLAQKQSNAKKRTASTRARIVKNISEEAVYSKTNGLLDALDELQSKGTNKRVSKQVISSLLRDPIHSPTMNPTATTTTKPVTTTAPARNSLLCSLDNLLNIPSQENVQGRIETKRSRSITPNEIIDLT